VRSLAGSTKCERILDEEHSDATPQGLLSPFRALTITKCERILDAKGGPQDCLLALRLITITKCERILDEEHSDAAPQGFLSPFRALTITKCERILDAKGGPKDWLLALRLININPFYTPPTIIKGTHKSPASYNQLRDPSTSLRRTAFIYSGEH